MQTYASTFPSGFKDVIAQAMKYCVPDGKILDIDDGVVVYKSNMRHDRLTKAPCFTNTFLVLASYSDIPHPSYKKAPKSPEYIIARLAKAAANKQAVEQIHNARGTYSTFRIMAWNEGEPVALAKNIREELENMILLKNEYVVNRLKPQSELAFHIRRDGIAFFGMRLTYPSWDEKKQPAQDIKRELAYLMCVISQPGESDVVLDPRAAHGTLMAMRAAHFPYKLIIAADSDEENAHVMKALHAKIGKQFIIEHMSLDEIVEEIPAASVSSVITQLPSSFSLGTDVMPLYRALFQTFETVLSPGGRLVFVSLEKEIIDMLVKDVPSFTLHNKWNILINGRKAAVYKLQKQAPILSG